MLCFEVLVLSWVGIKHNTAVFLRVRIYTVSDKKRTQDHRLFLRLRFILYWLGIKLRTINFLTIRFEILHPSWTRIKLKAADFRKVRVYTVLGGNSILDY